MNIKEDYEKYLASIIKNDYLVSQAMNYSFLANSKRIRSLLCFALLEDLGLNSRNGYETCAAIEMIHTYSLIHDDLPAFDNDDYRRGQLTNHKKFNETIAILAGDALLTKAFEQIANSSYSSDIKVKLITYLADYSGQNGMIKGQHFDMEYENNNITLNQYLDMIDLKTGKLITIGLIFAIIIANKEDIIDEIIDLGILIGRIFQIQDDLLDVLENKELTGKSSSDLENNKNTYVALTSIDETKQEINALFNKIYKITDKYPHVKKLINSLENRTW